MTDFFSQLLQQNREVLAQSLQDNLQVTQEGAIGAISELASVLTEDAQAQMMMQMQAQALGAYYGSQRPEFQAAIAQAQARFDAAELQGWNECFNS